MKAVAKLSSPISDDPSNKSIASRVEAIDWHHVSQELDAEGSTIVEHLLSAPECETLAALYANDEIFRSWVMMECHCFGRG